jgi:hypothetical protein
MAYHEHYPIRQTSLMLEAVGDLHVLCFDNLYARVYAFLVLVTLVFLGILLG